MRRHGPVRDLAVPCVAFALLSACVSVATKTTYREEPVRRERDVTTIAGSKRYFAKAKVKGDALALTVGSEHECRISVTPVFHKYAHHEKSVADTTRGSALQPRYMALYGLAFGALGTYSYLNADSLAATSTSTNENTPDDYENGGITLIGVGAVLIGIAAIDLMRLQDSHEDLGEVQHDAEISEEPCKRKPVADEKIIVRLRNERKEEWKAGDVTDEEGNVRIGLAELPESAFRSYQLELVAIIDDAEVPVVLTTEATSGLLDALAANPQSRVARDRDAQVAASCQEQFSQAQGLTVTVDTGARELELIERRWKQAKAACGDKWQPSHEASLVAFHEAVEQTARERSARSCADMAARALELFDQDPDLAEQNSGKVVETVRKTCDGVANAATTLAPVEARARRVETARARAAKREATLGKINERFSAHDALGLHAMVTKDADTKAILLATGQVPPVVRGLADYWIDKAGQGSGNQSQLCATRLLVKLAAGDLEWNKLRRTAVERAGVARGSKIAKAMEACK